ncbi:MAG: hypothetical protein OXH68_01165 [Gammaproteobacteria bacterium]|nr:hypothetical protein [Gammaproteobacteria bacterium]
MEAFMLVSAIVGMASGLICVLSAIYSGGKWLVARFKARGESIDALPPTLTVVNWITIGIERTVIVPFVVEKTVKVVKEVERVVVPVFVPDAPPRQPGLPDWLKPVPQRPEIRPDIPTEMRPDKKWRPSWTRLRREPDVPEYTHRRPGITTQRPEPDWAISHRMHDKHHPDWEIDDRRHDKHASNWGIDVGEPPRETGLGDRFGGPPRGGFNVESGHPFDVGGTGDALFVTLCVNSTPHTCKANDPTPLKTSS